MAAAQARIGACHSWVYPALNCAIVIVAHDVPLLLSVADLLVAMDLVRVIADGPPAEVVRQPAVVSPYLGSGIDSAMIAP